MTKTAVKKGGMNLEHRVILGLVRPLPSWTSGAAMENCFLF